MLRRLLLVTVAALTLASPVSAFSKQDETQTMDDGVSITLTRYTPAGVMPPGGWPGILVLHGLAGNRGSVDLIASAFASAGYAVVAYDARGHGVSGGQVTLAGPREVADLRALRNALAAREEVSDTKLGAWGISYGGGQIWNALAAGVPFAAVEVVETWTSLYSALWPQDLARSGIVAGFAATIAARSPLVAGIRDDAVQSRDLGAVRALAAERSVTSRLGSIRTPVYLFQGKIDFAFDLSQATSAFARLAGPKKLYAGNFGHPPSTFPGVDSAYVLSQGIAWYDRFLKGTRNGVDTKRVVIAKRDSASARVELAGLPRTDLIAANFGGTSTISRNALLTRQTRPWRAGFETWGPSGKAFVEVKRLVNYPRLVVTVLAGNRVVTHGGLKPRLGLNAVNLANYCVYVPKGTRLRVTVGASSPAGQIAYLGFADAGSATIGPIRLQVSVLAKPVSR